MNRLAISALVALAVAGCGRSTSEAALIAAARQHLEQGQAGAAAIEAKNALAGNPGSGAARLLLGQALLMNGDAAAASIELQKALGAGATDEQVVPHLARAMLQAGKGAELAERFAAKALSSADAAADLDTTMASAWAAQGRFDDARRSAQRALQAKPGYAPAKIVLARLALGSGDADAALRLLDEVLAADATHEAAGLLKGDILLRARNEPQAAVAIYRSVRDAHPRSVAGHTALANALIQQDRLAEAREEFGRLAKLAPGLPDTLYLEAQFAYADGSYAASYEILERMLVRLPDELRLLTLAATAQYQLRNYPLAISLYARALRAAPGHAMTRRLLAQTFLHAGQPEKAFETLRPIVEAANADAASLAMAGEAHLRAGNPKEAEAAFQRALKAAPGDTKTLTSLAMVQLAQGHVGAAAQLEAIARADTDVRADLALISERMRRNDLDAALQAVSRVQKKQPDAAFPDALRGRLLALAGNTAGAAAAFEQALSKDPKHFAAAAGLVEIDVAAGRAAPARKRLDALIEADPRNANARLARASLDARHGAADAAIVAQLTEAVKADPTHSRARLALIDRLLAAGDGQGATIAAQDAAAAMPNDAPVLDALGRAQIAAGEGERAVTTFRKLAAALPRSHWPHLRLADAHLALNDLPGATAALQQALKLQPDDPLAQRGLALVAAKGRRKPEALAIARALQTQAPKEPHGFALEGELEAGARNWAGAAAAYREALRRSESTDLAIKLHESLVAADRHPEADRLATEWLAAHAGDAVFRYHLGDVAVAAKDWARAERHYRAVLPLQPRHVAALNNIAWLMATQGKPGAVDMAERATALMPDRAPLLDTLSLAQEVENQMPEALRTQRRAVALDPKDPMLRLRLVRLMIKQGDKAGARAEIQPLVQLGSRFGAHAEVATLLQSL